VLQRVIRISAVASTLLCQICPVGFAYASQAQSGPAWVRVGQADATKSMIAAGPARKKDKLHVIWGYSIRASPPGVLSYEFIATHIDGSTDSIPAEEGDHMSVHNFFAGQLDLHIQRKSEDTSYPVDLYISMYSRTEGESDFP
jgi:hypothetical protein